jgi:hypothetical protein
VPPGEPSRITCRDCLSYAIAGLTRAGPEPAGVTNIELAHCADEGEAFGEPGEVTVGLGPPALGVPHAAVNIKPATKQPRFLTWLSLTASKINGKWRAECGLPIL